MKTMKTIKKMKTKKNKTYKKEQQKIITYTGFENEFEEGLSNKELIKTNEKIKHEFVKQLLTPFSSDAIKPNNNFYNYINYVWLKNQNIELSLQYLLQYDIYKITQNIVYKNLNEIIKKYIENNNNKQSNNYFTIYNASKYIYTNSTYKQTTKTFAGRFEFCTCQFCAIAM